MLTSLLWPASLLSNDPEWPNRSGNIETREGGNTGATGIEDVVTSGKIEVFARERESEIG